MDLASNFAELTEALSTGGSLILLTDYDGSLTPVVGHPPLARLPNGVRADLRSLARSPRVRVGVISGRGLEDLRRQVGLPKLIYAGCHGLEVGGRRLRFQHPEAEAQRGALEALVGPLAQGTSAIGGVLIEPKGLAVAVHYREVAANEVPVLEILVRQIVDRVAARRAGTRLKVIGGDHAFEILPDVGWGKGECAQWIWRRVAPGLRRPVVLLYMGDDWTDELVFQALTGKAITVRVGSGEEPTTARYRLPDVNHVLRLVSALAEEVGDRAG